MDAQPPQTSVRPGTLSADGNWRWNGSAWEPVPPAGWPLWARPYASAGARATFVVVSLAVLLVSYALSVMGDTLAIAIGAPVTDVVLVLYGLALLLSFAHVVSVVAFCMWIHRAYRNLPALGQMYLTFSPGWAVGWWFVPVASLWRPYQVMRELWSASSPSAIGWGLIKWWWAFWLVSIFVRDQAIISSRGGGSIEGVGILTGVTAAVAAILAILIVRRITAWQEEAAAAAAAAAPV